MTLDKKRINCPDDRGLYPIDYAILYPHNNQSLFLMIELGYTYNKQRIKKIKKNCRKIFNNHTVCYTEYNVSLCKKNNHNIKVYLDKINQINRQKTNQLPFPDEINDYIHQFM